MDMARGKADASLVVDQLESLVNLTSEWKLTRSNGRVQLKEYNLIIKELGDNGHMEQCEAIFRLMKADDVIPNLITYSTIIAKAAIWQKVGLAEKYFELMHASGVVPDAPVYNSLANAYAKSGQPERAFELVRVMEGRGVAPTVITFNTLINSCAHSGDIARASSVPQMMNQRGISPNSRTFSSLIHICCQAKEYNRALKLLASMKRENYEPTDVTLSLLVHGLGQGGDLQRAFELYGDMKSRKMKPNVVTLSSLVYACGKHRQLDRAFALYMEMSIDDDASLRPNSITCSSLIDACLKNGAVDRAFTVVDDMRKHKIPMTQVTYTSLITELTKLRRLDRIMEVVQVGSQHTATDHPETTKVSPQQQQEQVDSAGVKRSVAQKLAEALDEQLFVETALELRKLCHHSRLVSRGIDLLAFRASSGAKKLDSEEDLATLQSAVSSAEYLTRMDTAEYLQLLLDTPAFNASSEQLFEESCLFLLRECGKACRFRKIQATHGLSLKGAVVQRLVAESSSTYDNVIEAYQWIKDFDITPCARIYNQLLRSVNERSMSSSSPFSPSSPPLWQQRKQLKQDELFRLYLVFQEMRDSGINIDAATYNTLINACAAAGNLDKAIETVQAMQEEGILPDVITYTSLIKACRYNAAAGSVGLAETYWREMQQKENHFASYIAPTTYTYLQLMRTHLQSIEIGLYGEGDTRRVWDLLQDLLRQGEEPTIQIWRECVTAAAFDEDALKALSILSIIRDRLGVDHKSWESVIAYLSSSASLQGQYKADLALLRSELNEQRSRPKT
jgi:pentatricopeptide repeat protein